MITEQEKFEILSGFIKHLYVPVRINFCKPEKRKNRKPIDGYTNMETQTVVITLPDTPVHEADWSEAAAVLLHEYGHAVTCEYTERGAWRNADKLIRRYPLLKPVLYEQTKKSDLAEYKAMKKESRTGKVPGAHYFTY